MYSCGLYAELLLCIRIEWTVLYLYTAVCWFISLMEKWINMFIIACTACWFYMAPISYCIWHKRSNVNYMNQSECRYHGPTWVWLCKILGFFSTVLIAISNKCSFWYYYRLCLNKNPQHTYLVRTIQKIPTQEKNTVILERGYLFKERELAGST